MGIYDGFNSHDAPDFLSTNLYYVVHKELKDDKFESAKIFAPASSPARSEGTNLIDNTNSRIKTVLQSSQVDTSCRNDECLQYSDQENYPCVSQGVSFDSNCRRKLRIRRESTGKLQRNGKRIS